DARQTVPFNPAPVPGAQSKNPPCRHGGFFVSESQAVLRQRLIKKSESAERAMWWPMSLNQLFFPCTWRSKSVGLLSAY
ncbi:MAG: hypothetical protein NWS85_00820, partial [Hydrogenophaga sp.]|nr:hypothetical protein [Hydrogenophaga sp.]